MATPETFADLIDDEMLERFTNFDDFDEDLDQQIQFHPGLYWLFEHRNEEARDEIRKVYLLMVYVHQRHGIDLPWINQKDGLALTRDPDVFREDREHRAIGKLEATRMVMDEQLEQMPVELRDFLDPTRDPGYDPDLGQIGTEGWEVFALFARKFEDLEWELRLLQPDAPGS